MDDFQPKRAYKARAYNEKSVYLLSLMRRSRKGKAKNGDKMSERQTNRQR